jgi:broad specificity phosphatase PhoE
MSELIFVRHGQASFGTDSYDKLSTRGVEQVKLLACHWESLDERFDCVYSGTLLRQKETAHELLSLVKGEPLQAVEHRELNEYSGDPLLQIYLRDHAAREGFDASIISWPITDPRLFQQLFEAATSKWIRDELQPTVQDTAFEPWRDFQQRVHTKLDEIMAKHSGGSRVLISTSGGVIAMALQRVLQFPDDKVISTNWMVHNSAVTRVKYGNGKASLTQFNSLAHLEKAGLQHMVTYR